MKKTSVSNRRIIFVSCSLAYVRVAFGSAGQTPLQQSAEKLQVTRTMDHHRSLTRVGISRVWISTSNQICYAEGVSPPWIFRSDTSCVQVELHIAVPKVTLTYNNAPPLLLCPYRILMCSSTRGRQILGLSHRETSETVPPQDGHLLSTKPRLWTTPYKTHITVF